MICHVGLVLDGSPVVLPTCFRRDGDTIYVHGSTGSGNLRAAASGVDVCVTVTLLDGIVYARSLSKHFMNYRGAVVHGRAEAVTEREAKLRGLRVITDHLAPGSWEHARDINAKELADVTLLALSLAEASVKTRRGEPGDDPQDRENPSIWAGALPVQTILGDPVPAGYHPADAAIPDHVARRANHVRPAGDR